MQRDSNRLPDGVLKTIPFLTYGTTILGVYCPNVKLTSTKQSDLRNGRERAQSMNQGLSASLMLYTIIRLLDRIQLSYI